MANGANKKPRIEGDAYFTPGKPVRQIIAALKANHIGADWRNRRVLEPSCGAGNILTEVIGFGGAQAKNCVGVDVVDHPRGEHLADMQFIHGDFLEQDLRLRDYTLVIANPPYGDDLPERFVRRLLGDPYDRPLVVAMLLRLAWLSSGKRAALHRELPPDVYVLSERPSFTGNGKTDGADYAWFVWDVAAIACRGYGHVRVLGTEDPGQPGLF